MTFLLGWGVVGGSAAELRRWSVCASSKEKENTSVEVAEHRLESGGRVGGSHGVSLSDRLDHSNMADNYYFRYYCLKYLVASSCRLG